MMKNEHLIPANVLDLAEKITSQTAHENERLNYLTRLEAIRDYCDLTIKKANRTIVYNEPTRGFRLSPAKKKR